MTFVVSAGNIPALGGEKRETGKGKGSEDGHAADRLILTLGRIACTKEVRYRILLIERP